MRLTLLLLLLPSSLHAQDSLRLRGYEGAIQYGFIVPHTTQMQHLITGHSVGGFARRVVETHHTTWLSMHYGVCRHTFEVYYNNPGNPRQLGHHLALGYGFEIPIFIPKEKLHRSFLMLGLGAGYATKKWDLESNHQSPVLGSHFNIALTLGYKKTIASWNKNEISAGIRLTHYSNGAFQIPNLGTNNIALFLSYQRHNINRKTRVWEPFNVIDILPYPHGLHFSGDLSYGAKEILPPEGKKYSTAVLQLLASYRYSYKASVSAGLDMMYNSSIETLLERRDEIDATAKNVVQLGGVAAFNVHLSRIAIHMQQGFYLKDDWKDDGALYQRFIVRYNFPYHYRGNNGCLGNLKWYAQIGLKTHFAKADYGQLGIGLEW